MPFNIGQTFVFGEQPSATKWNYLWENDEYFYAMLRLLSGGFQLLDTSANEILIGLKVASAVNEFSMANAAAGGHPTLSATGSDSNINTNFTPKGTGRVTKAGNPIDTYEILGTDTGDGTGVMNITSLPARKYLRIIAFVIPSTTNQDLLTFNNDTGSNYAIRRSGNGGADSTATSAANLALLGGTNNVNRMYILDIVNNAAQEKTVRFRVVDAQAGAANAPERIEGGGKWANTLDQITRVDLTASTGNINSGSSLMVMGGN